MKTSLTILAATIALSTACSFLARHRAPEKPGSEVADSIQETIPEGHSKKQIDGIDVSHYQGEIDWPKVAENYDIGFVYIKATEGATHIDKNYRRNIEEARRNGFKVGSYHYFSMLSSPREQLRNMTRNIIAEHQHLVPMVDVESTFKHSVRETRDSLKVFLRLVEDHYGVRPVIYGTNRSYSSICGDEFLDYKSYIGRYSQLKKEPRIAGPDSCHYTVWQWTERGRLHGIDKPVDLCRFHPDASVADLLYSR